MTRINEKQAADLFAERLTGGYYRYDRSQNTEVKYCGNKEPRDTEAVKSFVQSKLFETVKNMK